MDPLTAGALISGGSSLASSLISNAGNKKAQESANNFNREMWKRQNEYNLPINQMQRLEDAGLNPHLIYGSSASGASGNAEKPHAAKAAQYNFESPMKDIGTFAQLKKTNATTDNLKKQNDVLVQEALLKSAQASETAVRSAKGKFDLGLAKKLEQTSLQMMEQNLKKMEQETIQAELETSFRDQTLQNRVRTLYYEAENKNAILNGTNLLNALRGLELDLKKLGIERNDPWYFRIIGRHLENLKDGAKTIGQGWTPYQKN